MPQDYNQTLNLPKTDFSMRASLPQKEPGMVQKWRENQLYEKMVARNAGKPRYLLHDGPPYANASIHLGTALNKVLKDIIVRSKNMLGYESPYVPGWDTHGLPIELKALAALGADKDISPVQLRQHCRAFALEHLETQMDQFRRLGTLADYDHPYVTLAPEFEAKQIEIFGEMAKKGYIYKGLKPVYWCPDCQTALAEAEIEYANDPCQSVYVKFQVRQDNGALAAAGARLENTYFVIWTTTTWTLPGNVAICVGPEYEYSIIRTGGQDLVMATELAQNALQAAGITEYETVGRLKGSQLEYIRCAHPFLDRESLVIVGNHVTLESGTGCVHTAPGHGVEDFEVCNNYPELPIIVPVDNRGVLNELAGPFAGLNTDQANQAIYQALEKSGHLLAAEKIVHQYPHCWRCKKPVLFRATEQWFCSVDKFRDQAVQAARQVHWIPAWGEDRMVSMVVERSDWCISRQRIWGVPIPIFYCKKCGQPHIDDASIQAVAKLFRTEGSDQWYVKDAADILPEGTVCAHCGGTEFTKETDIMDVWFDSGVTHAAVLDERDNLSWPADLYLEGTDQYRGWFQSSLLTAVAWRGEAPYRTICTHGWVVDGEGRKMSKSLGNGIEPKEIVDQYGADILRLWVASTDYHSDIRISKDILKQLSEVYRKIRNTARYILGNLYDFEPDRDSVADGQLTELDRWALMRADQMLDTVRQAYDCFEFHNIYHCMHNFCTIDLSNFYLDVIKDRLYVEKADSTLRRAAQTAIYRILRSMTLALAPVMPFTCEEIWSFLPRQQGDRAESVMLNDIPPVQGGHDPAFLEKWDKLHAIRDDVNKALEQARAQKKIGKGLDARVVLQCDGPLYDFIQPLAGQLAEIFIVSQVSLVRGPATGETGLVDGLGVLVEQAAGQKCERCWMYSESVGQDAAHPTLCARCAKIIG